jgi:16S rRNA G966 N2-methylase RsmD
MRATFREIDRLVLQAVSEDYQSFESLVSKLSRIHAQYGSREVERTLLSAIADQLVSAYLIHADPPYATEVGANAETIQRYWFGITEEGREYLRRPVPQQPVFRRRRIR